MNSNWPTPEEIEAQQSPFDPDGQYPFEYKIVIVEQVGDVFEEQLRTYTINSPLSPANPQVPSDFNVEKGRRFRLASQEETPDIRVMNQATSTPIGLIVME